MPPRPPSDHRRRTQAPGRHADFAEIIERRGLLAADRLRIGDPWGALVLTAHGSLVSLGAPGWDLVRGVRYEPAPGGAERAWVGRGRLTGSLHLGRPGTVGPLCFSKVLAIAVESPASGVDKPLPGSVLLEPEVPLTSWNSALGDHLRRLQAVGPGAGREAEECELLGLLLAMQRRLGRGCDLREVSGFWTANGGRYRVLPGPTADVLRTSPRLFLRAVEIDPQRIVEGAPVALLSAIDGRVMACTSIVVELEHAEGVR